jgi:hypothetical protein
MTPIPSVTNRTKEAIRTIEGGALMTVLTMLRPRKTQPLSAMFRERVLRKAPAPPIAHPFSHEDSRTRCPACELREYLEG